MKNVDSEKQPAQDDATDANKDSSPNEEEEKEPEEKVVLICLVSLSYDLHNS